MFKRTRSLSNAFRQLTQYNACINKISELRKLVVKIKQFNFKLNSSNVSVIFRYTIIITKRLTSSVT